MKRRMRGLPLAVLVLLGVSCKPPQPTTTPETAYRAFNDALNKGNAKSAWSALSEATRSKIKERSKAISEASQGAIRDEPEAFLFQTRPGVITSVTAVKTDETTAVLQIASASGTREVKLVKDSGTWFIDLSDQL